MEILQAALENTQFPFISAFILGIMIAISPCPLVTNITAIGFISKNVESRKKVFYNGLWYTLGRSISYTLLGVVLFFGANKFQIAKIFQMYGERILGPLLVIVGVLMLDLITIKLNLFGKLNEKISNKVNSSRFSAILLGMLFALAFCPYSGVLFFGMLIPMTLSSGYGMLLPLIFAIASGLPVILVAYILAFSISSIGNYYNKIKLFESWFRRITAMIFILVGVYFVSIYYFN